MFQQERVSLYRSFSGIGGCYTLPKYHLYQRTGDLIKMSANIRLNLNTRLEFYLERMALYTPSIVKCLIRIIRLILSLQPSFLTISTNNIEKCQKLT